MRVVPHEEDLSNELLRRGYQMAHTFLDEPTRTDATSPHRADPTPRDFSDPILCELFMA